MASELTAAVSSLGTVTKFLLSTHPEGTPEGIELRLALRSLFESLSAPVPDAECVQVSLLHGAWKTLLEAGLGDSTAAETTFKTALLAGGAVEQTGQLLNTRCNVVVKRDGHDDAFGCLTLSAKPDTETTNTAVKIVAGLKLSATDEVILTTHVLVNAETLAEIATTASKVVKQLNSWP